MSTYCDVKIQNFFMRKNFVDKIIQDCQQNSLQMSQ
nr:MAG TPA: hypothetical protein [Caudoviricetes sp.]